MMPWHRTQWVYSRESQLLSESSVLRLSAYISGTLNPGYPESRLARSPWAEGRGLSLRQMSRWHHGDVNRMAMSSSLEAACEPPE